MTRFYLNASRSFGHGDSTVAACDCDQMLDGPVKPGHDNVDSTIQIIDLLRRRSRGTCHPAEWIARDVMARLDRAIHCLPQAILEQLSWFALMLRSGSKEHGE